MRRKDGQPKLRARRSMPGFQHGFRDNPALRRVCHPNWFGERTSSNISAVSLFAGCGGLDLGFSGGFAVLGREYPALPIDVVAAYDNSPDAVETYRLNLGSDAHLVDLTEAAIAEIPRADVLLGGFPCQDFSSSGPKVGLSGKRGQLYRVLSEYMAHHRPSVVIGENVPHLERLRDGAYLKSILREFESQGYHFDVWRLNAPDFGVPQSRRRLFLVGVRNDLPGYPVRPEAPFANRPLTVDRALADLEEIVDESIANQSQYFVATAATAGGGQGDHVNRSGAVAYCIRANARGRIQFHYRLPRRLTVRECARLQTFPDEFVFPYSTQRNLTLIGNAVPPVLAHFVARSVVRYLRAFSRSHGPSAGAAAEFATRDRLMPEQHCMFLERESSA